MRLAMRGSNMSDLAVKDPRLSRLRQTAYCALVLFSDDSVSKSPFEYKTWSLAVDIRDLILDFFFIALVSAPSRTIVVRSLYDPGGFPGSLSG